MFSEVAILERFKGKPGMCQLLDYGLSGDDFILVMQHYSCSLKSWRNQLPACPDRQLRLYLAAFHSIVSAVQASAQPFAGSLMSPKHCCSSDICDITHSACGVPASLLLHCGARKGDSTPELPLVTSHPAACMLPFAMCFHLEALAAVSWSRAGRRNHLRCNNTLLEAPEGSCRTNPPVR